MKSIWRTFGILFLASSLGHCATLPNVHDVDDNARAEVASTQRAWLNYRESQRLIERLGAAARGEDFLAAHLRVEEAVAGTPLTTGNEVTIFDDGPDTYEAMFQAIENAKKYIYLETYIFEGDELGQKMARMLADKRAQGVYVAVTVDGVGTLGTPEEMFDTMRDAGVEVMVFNPVNPLLARTPTWSLNKRNHRKILVVDGVIGFTGGVNVSDVYSSSSSGSSSLGSSSGKKAKDGEEEPPWRDTHVRLHGPAAFELQKVFVKGWRDQNGPPLQFADEAPAAGERGQAVVRVIANDPNAEDGFSVYLTLMSAISSAQQSIQITMAYFVPDPAFIQALQDAAGRGVKVALVLPEFSDSSLVLHAGRSHYADLLEAGVVIYERTDALLHAKTAVIDGVWSTIGSSNLDWRSFTLNYEVNAVILGRETGRKMQALFDEDVSQSRQVTLEQWNDRGISPRFMEFLGRLAERWL